MRIDRLRIGNQSIFQKECPQSGRHSLHERLACLDQYLIHGALNCCVGAAWIFQIVEHFHRLDHQADGVIKGKSVPFLNAF